MIPSKSICTLGEKQIKGNKQCTLSQFKTHTSAKGCLQIIQLIPSSSSSSADPPLLPHHYPPTWHSSLLSLPSLPLPPSSASSSSLSPPMSSSTSRLHECSLAVVGDPALTLCSFIILGPGAEGQWTPGPGPQNNRQGSRTGVAGVHSPATPVREPRTSRRGEHDGWEIIKYVLWCAGVYCGDWCVLWICGVLVCNVVYWCVL